jgi:hypothetical protein
MEASQAGLKDGFTLYLKILAGGDPLPGVWESAPLRTEEGAQLYYFTTDTSPGQPPSIDLGEEWAVYSPEAHGAAVPVTSEEPKPEVQPNEQPDASHAPAAVANEKAIVGDAGLGEQQPSNGLASQDVPLVNATPPQAQSGVPLAEDRAAGVEADPEVAGTVAPQGVQPGTEPGVGIEEQPTA